MRVTKKAKAKHGIKNNREGVKVNHLGQAFTSKLSQTQTLSRQRPSINVQMFNIHAMPKNKAINQLVVCTKNQQIQTLTFCLIGGYNTNGR